MKSTKFWKRNTSLYFFIFLYITLIYNCFEVRKINTIKHLSQTNLGTGPINPSIKNTKNNKLNQQINSKLLSSNVNSIKNHLIFDPLLNKVHKVRKTLNTLSIKTISKDDNIDITGDQDVFFGIIYIYIYIYLTNLNYYIDILPDKIASALEISLLIENRNKTDFNYQLFALMNYTYCDFFMHSAALENMNFRKAVHNEYYRKFTKFNKKNSHFKDESKSNKIHKINNTNITNRHDSSSLVIKNVILNAISNIKNIKNKSIDIKSSNDTENATPLSELTTTNKINAKNNSINNNSNQFHNKTSENISSILNNGLYNIIRNGSNLTTMLSHDLDNIIKNAITVVKEYNQLNSQINSQLSANKTGKVQENSHNNKNESNDINASKNNHIQTQPSKPKHIELPQQTIFTNRSIEPNSTMIIMKPNNPSQNNKPISSIQTNHPYLSGNVPVIHVETVNQKPIGGKQINKPTSSHKPKSKPKNETIHQHHNCSHLKFCNNSYTNLTIKIKKPKSGNNPKTTQIQNVQKNITIMVHDPKTGHLCSICSELSGSIATLYDIIKKLAFEFKVQSIKKYIRQEQIIILSYWLTYVNLIKSVMYKINEVLYATQDNFCKKDNDSNNKYIAIINNFVGQLVDVIQKTIRQQNLNLSLILLT